MKILLSNDDGYQAPGLVALYSALKELGEVIVVAPAQNCSGASNSLTLHRPLSLSHAANDFMVVNGTPTDCVHIAITHLLKSQQKPDILVSGINDGQNMGEDTLYSGTVAAAIEGFMFGIPSFAFSLVKRGWNHLDAAARVAYDIVQHYNAHPIPGPFLFNINIPNQPNLRLDDICVTRLGKRHPSQSVVEQLNPRGEPVYWIGSTGDTLDASSGTDFYAVNQGKISITPLQLDLTHKTQLRSTQDWLEK